MLFLFSVFICSPVCLLSLPVSSVIVSMCHVSDPNFQAPECFQGSSCAASPLLCLIRAIVVRSVPVRECFVVSSIRILGSKQTHSKCLHSQSVCAFSLSPLLTAITAGEAGWHTTSPPLTYLLPLFPLHPFTSVNVTWQVTFVNPLPNPSFSVHLPQPPDPSPLLFSQCQQSWGNVCVWVGRESEETETKLRRAEVHTGAAPQAAQGIAVIFSFF